MNGSSITQCYVNVIDIIMSGYSDSAHLGGDALRRAGGLIGSSNNNLISSCFTYACNLGDGSVCKKASESKAAGLIAGFDNIDVMNCATNNYSLNDYGGTSVSTNDEFIPYSVSNIRNCYVSSSKYENINNCEIVDEAFWITPSRIRDKLNLVGYYWKCKTGQIPYPDFSE